MHSTSVRIDADTHEDLKRLAHDLGTTVGDVSLDSWTSLDGMIAVVRRTGHSSFYVEKGMGAMGKTPKQLGLPPDLRINGGGALPIAVTPSPPVP